MSGPRDDHGLSPDEERTVFLPPRYQGSPPPYPPQPYPGGQPPPGPWGPPPRRRSGWVPILAATALVAVVAVVVVVVIVMRDDRSGGHPVAGTPASPSATAPAAPPVPISALQGLLLTEPEFAAAVGTPTLVDGAALRDSMFSDVLVDGQCAGRVMAGTTGDYEGSGYTAVRIQAMESPTKPADPRVVEAVVVFTDSDAATRYLSAAQTKAQGCADRNVNLRSTTDADAGNDFWAVGGVTTSDGTVRSSAVEEGQDGWTCHRGTRAVNNVVIDVSLCGKTIADSAVPVVISAIGDKVRLDR